MLYGLKGRVNFSFAISGHKTLIDHLKLDGLIQMFQNKTKWPRQVRELILDSDSEILDFWSFDEKNNGGYSAYSAYSA